jgi:hypothetical protein
MLDFILDFIGETFVDLLFGLVFRGLRRPFLLLKPRARTGIGLI